MSTVNTGIVGLIHGSRSASFRAANAHLLSPQSSPSPVAEASPKRKDGAQRIRQNAAGLNKTEQAFADWLKAEHAYTIGFRLYAQAITLKLGNGVRYTPDFITKEFEDDSAGSSTCLALFAYEVKGFMRDDAAVKLKVAAAQYPWIKFHLVTKKKGGGWDIQGVLA